VLTCTFWQKVKVKVEPFLNKAWKLREEIEYWASTLPSTFDSSRMVDLSALRASRNLRPKEILWYPFLLGAEWTPKITECGLGQVKMSEDPIEYRTRDLQSCDSVPQPTAPPLARMAESTC
jgi:hypothetical protein